MYCIPGTLAYQANNITSQSKRAVANATALMGSGIGGIIAGVAFKSSESPVYLVGCPMLTPDTSLTSFSDWPIHMCGGYSNQRRNDSNHGHLFLEM